MKAVSMRTVLIWMSLVMVSLLFTSLSHARVDPKTIAGLWFFDDGAGDIAKDSSGNGNDGTLMGKPKWVKGKYGSALEFNGTNYVSCGTGDSLKMTSEVTVMFWFRTDKVMKAADMWNERQVVVAKHHMEYEVGIYPAGQIHTYTSDGAGSYDEGIMTTMAGKLPDKDADWDTKKWYHIAWTLNMKHEVAYVNGVKIGEYDKAHEGTKAGTNPLEIGRRVGGSLYFIGDVDEVVVLKVALQAADVKSVAERGMAAELGLTAVGPAGKLTTTWSSIKKQ